MERLKLSAEQKFSLMLKDCTSKGGLVISTEYVGAKAPFHYHCRLCGRPHYTNWNNFHSRGCSWECPLCNCKVKPSIDFIRKVFTSIGAFLITSSYINSKQKLYFKCSSCGAIHFTTWAAFCQGHNTNFLCPLCNNNAKPSKEDLDLFFFNRGSNLLSSYKDAHTPLIFLCTDCGEPWTITWANARHGLNPNLLCGRCNKLARVNPSGFDITRRISEFGGQHWYCEGRMFFSVKSGSQGIASNPFGELYSFHHIFSFEHWPLLRSSLTNGFPVLTNKVHGLRSPYSKVLHSKAWFNPESWNSDEFQNLYPNLYQLLKLPYHSYPNFKFHDLTQYLITETYLDATPSEEIHRHEQYWQDRGVIYIPVSWKTYAIKETMLTFFNQIRDELRPYVLEIDYYTGAKKYNPKEDFIL